MKVLIAVVMFLFGVFVGFLVTPFVNEFAKPMYVEEEYSSPRIKTLLNSFGITLPLEASEVNLFVKQDGEVNSAWLKFSCSPEVKEEFVEELTRRHPGLFNREVETPKMFDGTMITWWNFNNSLRYYEFDNMCAAYDDVLRNLYVYAVSGGSKDSSSDASAAGFAE